MVVRFVGFIVVFLICASTSMAQPTSFWVDPSAEQTDSVPSKITFKELFKKQNANVFFNAQVQHFSGLIQSSSANTNYATSFSLYYKKAFTKLQLEGNFNFLGYQNNRWELPFAQQQPELWNRSTYFIANYKPNKIFTFKAGYGKIHMGEGIQSAFYGSDHFNYPFLNISSKFWKIEFINHFAVLNSKNNFSIDQQYRTKFTASHWLKYQFAKKWSFQVFESVVWAAQDESLNRGFDFAYLNPIIFYRPVEFASGSSDNVLVGAALNYSPTESWLLYSQFMLDEFLLSSIQADLKSVFGSTQSNTGWWANKYALQLGTKVNSKKFNSKIWLEYNVVRPFTYSHSTPMNNYGHFDDPLAFSYESNFNQFLLLYQYQPTNRYNFEFAIDYLNKGLDIDSLNLGGSLLESNSTKAFDYGNTIGQGIKFSNTSISLTGCYKVSKKAPYWVYLVAGTNVHQQQVAPYLQAGITIRKFNWFNNEIFLRNSMR